MSSDVIHHARPRARAISHRSPLFDWVLASLLLLNATASFAHLFRPAASLRGADSDPILQGLWAILALVACWRVLRMEDRPRPPMLLVLLGGLVVLSLGWSIDPTLTARRGVSFGATVAVSYYLSATFSTRQLYLLIRNAATFIALASIALYLAVPGLANDEYGKFRGVVFHKNQLGVVVAIGVVIAITLALEKSGGRGNLVSLGACSGVLLMTGSRTALVSAAATVVLTAAFAALTRKNSQVGVAGALSLSLALAVVALPHLTLDRLFGGLDRSSNLTGRTQLWEGVEQAIRSRPISGWGYGAFWQNPDAGGPSAMVLRSSFDAASAHNGYLELWLGIGIVGLIVGVALLLDRLRHCIVVAAAAQPFALVGCAVIVFALVYNVGEADLFKSKSLLTLCLLVATLGSSRPDADALWPDDQTGRLGALLGRSDREDPRWS